MKKLFTTLILTVLVSTAFAQGLVHFANTSTTLISIYPAPANPPGFYFALLSAPLGTTDPTQFVFSGVYATNIAVAGRIQGGSTCNSTWPPAMTRSFMVVGWSADAGYVWNQSWLTSPPSCGSYFGYSMIATGMAGGADPVTGLTFPALPLFSGTTINTGWTLWAGDPIFGGFSAQPTNQTVTLGAPVLTCAAAFGCGASFEWYFNGNVIPGSWSGGQTTCYSILSAQLTNAGDYFAVGTIDGRFFHTSAVAHLTVVIPPSILSQPRSQTAEVGANVRFQVTATGMLPLNYQWFLNGSNPVPAATASQLVIPGAQTSDGGVYTVVVTTSSGAVTSAPAMLSVIPPVPRRTIPGLVLTGQAGQTLNLDFAGSLDSALAWGPLGSVDLTNASEWYMDLTAPSPQQRFYRAWQSGAPTLPSALELHLVPALTLTGSVGSSVRVDYINQFGLTDAWVPLSIVTLTNTSQQYFDTSMIDQPPRLYRLVLQP
jgi:hypothetical protein